MDKVAEDEKKPCTYEDLVIYGTGEFEYQVTEDFEIGDKLTDTGLSQIDYVECNNCDESFNGLQDAKEHIEEQ